MKFLASYYQVICIVGFGLAKAQFSGWKSDQINTSICQWEQPRVALVRDTVYLDGGTITWSPGLANGRLDTRQAEPNKQGYILTYNLSRAFAKDSNLTDLLVKDMFSKARGDHKDGFGIEPNYFDGAMLANDAEFFLYGGTVFESDAWYRPPAEDLVMGYRRYAYGPQKTFSSAPTEGSLGKNVTRYVAYGGAASAPSENKAWYFSGLTSPTRGPIITNAGLDGSISATNVSNTLITLDMTTQLFETWSNDTLPDTIKGRANSEVVWVPVGKQGILVVLGGVVYPEWSTGLHKSENETLSSMQSPEFMRIIDVYDVSNKAWYQQTTKGGPGARTRGCAVVAPSSDSSSFNIYYYGGFDGIHPQSDFSDEVWVLSLPSFTWTLISKGTSAHGRAGHKCIMPYPDQMMVFGGYASQKSFDCLDQGPIVVFNLTSGTWLESYSPTKFDDYGVHQEITRVIGGDSAGGATMVAPAPSGWSTKALGDVFSTAYDRKKLKHYWPYSISAAPTTTSAPDSSSAPDSLLKILIPAILVPVAFLCGIAIAIWYTCRRRKRGSKSTDGSTVADSSRNVIMWLRGHGATKQLTVTDSRIASTAVSPDLTERGRSRPSPLSEKSAAVLHEMEDTQVVELCGANSPAELHDTGFTPLSPSQRNLSYFGPESPYSPLHAAQFNKGHRATESVSTAPQMPHGGMPSAESPEPEPAVRLISRIQTPSSGSLSVIQHLQDAIPEEAQMESPMSPCVANTRYPDHLAYPASLVSPLQQTASEDEQESGKAIGHRM